MLMSEAATARWTATTKVQRHLRYRGSVTRRSEAVSEAAQLVLCTSVAWPGTDTRKSRYLSMKKAFATKRLLNATLTLARTSEGVINGHAVAHTVEIQYLTQVVPYLGTPAPG